MRFDTTPPQPFDIKQNNSQPSHNSDPNGIGESKNSPNRFHKKEGS